MKKGISVEQLVSYIPCAPRTLSFRNSDPTVMRVVETCKWRSPYCVMETVRRSPTFLSRSTRLCSWDRSGTCTRVCK